MQQITDFELSLQQRRVWRRQELEGQTAYTAQALFNLEGKIQPERLEAAIAEVVSSYEILRTGFVQITGQRQPLATIKADARPNWEILDLRGANAEAQAVGVERLWQAELRSERTTEQFEVLHARLVLLSEQNACLLLRLPALCGDAQTLRNLCAEISRAYDAEKLDQEPLQYPDLSEWQNELLESTDGERGKTYWRDCYGPEWFTGSRNGVSSASFDPAVLSIEIDPQVCDQLNTLPLYQESPAVFLLSCWLVLLWRLRGCEGEVFVTVSYDGRGYEELRDAIGLLEKYLPLGHHPEASENLADVAARVKQTLRDNEKWQEHFNWENFDGSEDEATQFLPFAFDYDSQAQRQWQTTLLNFTLAKQWICTDRFNVKLRCAQLDHTLTTEWHYDAALYDAAEIRQLAERYQKLLTSVAHNPQATLAELEILGDEERAQLLVEWNATATEYERELCVYQLFEAQVERTPDAVALLSGKEKLSYATLNARANRLARLLKDSGVGPEVIVGVLLDRSTEMVVALLAILKAGGAYVPLDPSYPRERLEFMLADSQAAVLLTNDKAVQGLDAGATRVICLDGTWGAIIAGQSAENLPNVATANNLAYVIYTSGSTGRPKGAMITQQGLVNYLSWAVKHYEVAKGSGAPVHSSISFDLTVTSLFPALLSGRRVELLSEEKGVEGLAASLLNRAEEFSLIKITPAHLMMLNHLLPPDKTEARVHTLVIGGEALRLDIVESWRRAGKRLINEYGPTEAVVGCIVYEVSDDVVRGASAPEMALIGRPIANAEVYILDERQQPVAIGTSGEIYLGGDGVARGYLNRPDVTAEKFVPHPFATSPGKRLYRTGDLGRYLPNGELEYLGRADYQVKVRGYRIELGEIESCLREHEKVSDAVVTLHEDASGAGHLIAYVVSADKARVPENELRRHLTERLPDYMVPARLVFLEELPLTHNGKVDRRALPPREQAQAREKSSESRSLLEEMLVDIWSHVLNVKDVGVHDNFFERGGHSLLAMRLISRLREVFEVEPTIDDIFDTDTLSDLAQRLSELIAEQQSGASLPLQRVERDGEIPLSFAQQRLWFLDKLTPGSFAYNIPAVFRVHGLLDISALEQSLNEVLRRHESLRTTFIDLGGKPQQVIVAEATIALPVTDLSDRDADQQQQEVMRLAAEEARKPFDLARGPLLRVSLLRCGVDDHVVLSTMHHIVSDGWSMGLLINEVAVLYEAFRAKRESPLPELPVQYADYAVWQRSWLSDEVVESQLAFWRNQMENAPPVLNLPADYHRPAMLSHRGATLPVTVSAELGARLKSLSRGEGMTSFMTILAAFAALLSRYSGQRDLVIGVPVAGRNRVEIEKLIGFFINTLPLRIDLEGDPSFRTLLRRVRQTMLGAYAHQDIPFEKMVEALQPARDRSRSPLFQVSCAWNNFGLEALSVGELEMTRLESVWQTAKFDLTLSLAENPSGTITGDIEYATELFKAETIQRLGTHFQYLLELVAANPEKRLSELSVLTDDELEQVYRWNDTAKVYPEQDFLPELFAAQAERTPDAIAVVSEKERVTYAELNRRANRLAHYLRELGVGPDVLVGIMAERSVELVVGLLGILKAGGAFVPFDTSNPPGRLSYMLQDSGVAVLLTQSPLVYQLSGYTGIVDLLDAEDESIAQADSSNLASNVSVDNLAYMIYTSGSTGRPKGATNTHGAIRNRLLWMQDVYRIQPEDRLLQKTPSCFDISVWEFFWPLLNGARLVVARPGGHRDSAYLRRVIADEQISMIHFVPSMLRTLLDEPVLEGTECLRHVFCSGEELSLDLQQHFSARLKAELHNLYGPTEAAVEVSNWTCQPDDGRGTVPIGRPIANLQLYILDRKLRPVPVGIVNELYIAGAGLARGYLGKPGLTAEKFIPNPHSKVPGARLYRTGDLARYRADGAIEFAGRVDYQVKLRGYRMELGEIETVLSEHHAVHEAVIVAREDEAGGDKRLIAYVVAEHSQSLDLGELRRHAQSHLPDYMLPAAFVLLDQLPLTATGKINYRALPNPDQQRLEGVTDFVAPRTPFEETLCGIWSDLLRIKQIGVHDNFFELGGHSLLATQMVSRIRDAFQVELPLATLFEFPTISELTKAIATARASQEDASEITEMLEQLKQLTPDDVKLMLKTAGE